MDASIIQNCPHHFKTTLLFMLVFLQKQTHAGFKLDKHRQHTQLAIDNGKRMYIFFDTTNITLSPGKASNPRGSQSPTYPSAPMMVRSPSGEARMMSDE